MLTHNELLTALPDCLDSAELPAHFGQKISGKVRDIYLYDDHRILITTDRISAFDRVLGLVPYKGQVLNQLSAWWFEQTSDIARNHVIAVPDPNVTIAAEAQPLPLEIVVRGYITGVTTTSLWYLYENGDRQPYGIALPNGLQKNDPLPQPIITPTTKALSGHDEIITVDAIVASGLVSAEMWSEISATALAVFKRGQEVAARGGLILVDTKYEMGLIDGQLTLIDEVHTPDSSRYWLADSYDERRQPVNFSKEFMRKWYADQGYRGVGEPPVMPDDLRAQIAARYIATYEKLTGSDFVPGIQPAQTRIAQALQQAAF
ncbi:MAG: phosphoribosylaminoimidazolesuccinocarboxamide synthase [Anaerolineae bacterium]|nr:phosphoribosylaminoimidazolesuccinocarboxamide synthase [Anaerolineae bacterium]